MNNFGEKVTFIWSVADLLRGPYRPNQYKDVMLPMTVLRRLDCALEPTKDKVRAKRKSLEGGKVKNVEPILCCVTGVPFFNTSRYTFEKLKGDPDNIAANLTKPVRDRVSRRPTPWLRSRGTRLGRGATHDRACLRRVARRTGRSIRTSRGPDARSMPVRTERPRMTVARALFLRLMQRYAVMAYRLTLLEMEKLAYFLQESGEPLRLKYEEGLYGPYAHNLNKVLEVLEGHFIRGYGDTQKPDVEIDLLPGAVEESDRFLAGHTDSTARLKCVAEVIEGFETPYGMELLSSVHWVAAHGTPPAAGRDEAVQAVHGWNDRKRAMFKAQHLRVAWDRLEEQGWLKGNS